VTLLTVMFNLFYIL